MAALTAGALLGVLGPVTGAADGSATHAASLVLSAEWTWAALAFFVGLAQKSKTGSAVLASASLIAGVIAYYAVKLNHGDFLRADLSDPSGATTHTDWAGVLPKMVVWSVAACLLGSLLGLCGNLARRGGLLGVVFRLVVPLIAIVDTSQRLQFEGTLQGSVARATWEVVRIVAVVAVVVVTGWALLARRSRPAGESRQL
ncbi:hypothetical protein [Streptomyces sp. NRRL WC-3742]|uniref:hypothetical protein n=1 Tax=Streptomyces sp. NRRL WC-3742 TaxID=1463934 RepID=UPI000AF08784|nr:hypothetical protein [Streptomyces sp. NRRL WC-3742]